MWVNFVPSGNCVVNAVNDAIIFVLASPSLLPFQGKQVHETLQWEKKKLCVSEMTVDVKTVHLPCQLP